MTGWRFAFLLLIAFFLAGIGAFLFFEPAPAQELPQVAVSEALLASSASAGVGLWLPQLAMLGAGAGGAPTPGPVLIALAPTRTPQLVTAQTPVIAETAEPLDGARLPSATASPTLTPPPSSTPTTALTQTRTDVPTARSSATRPLSTNTPRRTDTPTVRLSPTRTRTPGPSNTPVPTRTVAPTRTSAPTRTPVDTGGLANAIRGCGDINNAGGYYLTQSIGASGDCIKVHSSNVTLDCRGQSINGSNKAGHGIEVSKIGFLGLDKPSKVEIRNCNISGFRYGIYVEASQGIYIHHNNVSNNYDDVDGRRYGIFLGMVDGGGIRLNESTGGRIENNTTNGQAIGIDVRSSSGIKVRGNTSSNNSAWGINIHSTGGSEISGNTTASNVRYCTWGAGVVGLGCDAGGIILQNGSSNNVVSSNQVLGNNGNGIFIKAHAVPCGNNNVLSSNTITGAIYNSIELGFCSGNQIIGNVMSGGTDGIFAGFLTNTTIRGNTIQNQGNHGIIMSNSHDNTLSNNTLINDREGFYINWEQKPQSAFWWIDLKQYRSFNNCLCGNIFRNNTAAGIHLENSTNNQVTGNTFSNNRRTVWVQGDSGGNVITDNHDESWLPGFPLLLAFSK